jgi:hypothetical protein
MYENLPYIYVAQNAPAKMKMNKAMSGTRAGLEVGMRKQSPDANNDQAMFGNVNNRRLRRPNCQEALIQMQGSLA